MADLPVAEGGRGGGGKSGGSHWLVIGAIAGVGTLAVLLLQRGGGGTEGKTTAAGTSINAALGSIQEQNLNLMGQLGASTNLLSTQADQYNQSTLAALSGMQNALSDQMTGIDTHIGDVDANLSGQLHDINGNVISNGQSIRQVGGWVSQVGNMVSTFGAQQAGFNQWLTASLAALYHQGDVISGQVGTVGNQVAGVSGQVSNLGNAVQYSTQQTQQYGNTLYQYLAQLQSMLSGLTSGSQALATSQSGGGGGGGGHVSTYTINLPGGGQIRTNANSYAAAVNNVAGMLQ